MAAKERKEHKNMKSNKIQIDAERRKLIDRAMTQLLEILQYFDDVNSWNENTRKPDEAKIEPDSDGQMSKISDSLADLLCRESVHKIPRIEWIAQIKKVAKDKYEFTDAGIAGTHWLTYFEQYYLDCTPEQALIEDFSNA